MKIQERFFAVGSRVQRRTYSVRDTWSTWMTGMVTPDQAPFAVLSGMADHLECGSPERAQSESNRLNLEAEVRGTLQTHTVVVP